MSTVIELVVCRWPLLPLYFNPGFSQRHVVQCVLCASFFCITQVLDEWQGLPGDHGSTAVIHGALANVPTVQMAAQQNHLADKVIKGHLHKKNPWVPKSRNMKTRLYMSKTSEVIATLPGILLTEIPVSWPHVPYYNALSDLSWSWQSADFKTPINQSINCHLYSSESQPKASQRVFFLQSEAKQ